MGQVNALGTGGTFTADAKKYGLTASEVSDAARAWYAAKPASPVKTYYPYKKGNVTYNVELTYNAQSYNLTCTKIEKA